MSSFPSTPSPVPVELSFTLRQKGASLMQSPASPVLHEDILLTFKEAMAYLRVSRSTLYRLMWSGQLVGHKVGSTWRFYRQDLRACVGQGTVPSKEATHA
jgi:excisionase family DNA binding protein